MTIDQSMTLLKSLGYAFKLHDGSEEKFYVYLDSEMVDYMATSSNLQRMDFVVEMVASSKFNQGFAAGEKSKAEEIKNSLCM